MRIAGVDEAGRGPLAGPVVAAAAVFSEGYTNPLFRDSKKLSGKQRDYLFDLVTNEALDYAIVAVGHHRIERWNIRGATKLAMSLAVRRVDADRVIIDGNMLIATRLPQEAIVGGDAKCVEISAASILAKVWRDRLMVRLGEKYPGYGLDTHAGYPTELHRSAIARLGPCRIHRRSFRGVREFLASGPVSSASDLPLVEDSSSPFDWQPG